jgi:hypothetical protein
MVRISDCSSTTGIAVNNAFESLIAPLNGQDFILRYWGKAHFVGEGHRDRFTELFSWSALSEILSTHRFEFPRLRLLSGGRVAPPAQYMVHKVDRRGDRYITHDSEAVTRMLRDGAMLHITSIGEAWKPLATFAAQLEPILGAKVQVNLHAGYAASRGFHTHWDGHDVYAAQVDGRKRWRLFGFTEESPLSVPPDEKHGAPSSPSWEGILDTGNLLYLPRGYWHATQFMEDPSLHLTFAVQHPTAIDFSQWLLVKLSQDARARRDIPVTMFDLSGKGATVKKQYIADVRELMLSSISTESLDSYLNEYRMMLGKTNQLQLVPTERTKPCPITKSKE